MQISSETLKTARLACAMTLKSLSEATGISSPTLSRMESGDRVPSTDEAHTLASALNQPLEALCRPLVTEKLGLSAFYHRKLSRASAKAVQAIEAQCSLNIIPLRELFNMTEMPEDDSVFTIDLDDAKGSAEVAAHMVRQAWRLPDGPIDNIFKVVESVGCVVIHRDFGIREMDALYQKVAGSPPIFWVNSRKPLDRVRFSVAHELGHLILHEERPVDDGQAEREADEFASAFLMPKGEFKSTCPANLKIHHLVQLKRYWRCSMSAIVRRAKDTGRITPDQYKTLNIIMSKRGWRKCEPHPITPESPTLLANTINACITECELTIDELSQRLVVPVQQLRDWIQPFPGQVADPFAERPTLRLVTDPSSSRPNYDFTSAQRTP